MVDLAEIAWEWRENNAMGALVPHAAATRRGTSGRAGT
jgi:hypothetical protein